MNQLNPNNFFDQTGGGSGAPSAQLSVVNDFVHGEIVDQFMAPATDYSTKKQKLDRDGNGVEQLVIILQTELRGWAGVKNVPLKVKDDASSGTKDPADDDGKRAVYVEPWTNIHGAVGAAVIEATGEKGPVLNGGTLGVKIIELRNTGKGNPLKVHQAIYKAPATAPASSDFFSGTQAGQPDAAPAAQAPAPTQPSAQEQVATPPVTPSADPWATPASAGAPPF